MALPEGFTLEQPQINLPEGFRLEQPSSMEDKLKALYEVPTAIVRGAVDPLYANAVGIAKSIPEAIRTGQAPAPIGSRIAQETMQNIQYQPESPVTKDILGAVGQAFETAKIPPYLGNIGAIPSAVQASQVVRPAINQAMQAVKPTANPLIQALRKEAPTMAGVGAAEVSEAVNRVQMAKQLRVPVELSKGQAERNLAQQRFEIETPKQMPEIGAPLVEAQAKRNDAILQNFDAFVDATGKETYGLRETGKVVDKALVGAANKAKAEINVAYEAARNAGEMQAPVNYAPLQYYIENQTPTVKRKLAPILSAVEEEINKNDPEIAGKRSGQISINKAEDIYQFINQHYEPGTPAGKHAIEMKNIINQMMEGQGGELYQEARKLRTKFGREFENIGYVDKMLRTKPGTTDRAVAYEDVFKHSILDGSLDDVRAIGMTLKKAGTEGQQAWKELQGQTIEHIKDRVAQSVDVDSFGNPVVSPAKFKSVVRELDQDGKLDYIFGKSGAQEIRDLLETTINVNAPLKGATNYSNTASTLINALDKINKSPIGKIPVAGSVAKYAAEKAKESALKKQVQESINYDPLAEALRKGKK